MTEAEMIRIDLALETVGGNRAQAAALLDIPKRKLINAIGDNKALRDKWRLPNAQGAHAVAAPTEAPTMLQTIEVPAPSIPPVTPDQHAMAVILARENDALKKGFSDFGLTDAESDEALAITKFYGKHGGDMCDLFGGALGKRGIRLSMLLSDIEEKIKSEKFRDIYSPDGSVMIRSGQESLFEIYYRGIDQLRRIKALLDDGRMAQAKIKMWEEHGKNGKNGKGGKPGFSPLKRPILVKAENGSTVNLNEARPKEPPKE